MEVVADRAVALPPLNRCWRATSSPARGSQAARGLSRPAAGDQDAVPGADPPAQISSPTIPEIVELDINPLLADPRGSSRLTRVCAWRVPGPAEPKDLPSAPTRRNWKKRLPWAAHPSCYVIRPEDEARLKQLTDQDGPEDIYLGTGGTRNVPFPTGPFHADRLRPGNGVYRARREWRNAG